MASSTTLPAVKITDIAQFTPAAWAKIHNTTAPT
jgi:hypothetical protein